MSNENKLSTRILVIWENIDYQNLFSYFLKKLGYAVEIVVSCDEGLSVTSNNPPDLLILLRWNQSR
jgi:DNA-binding response OmpR family regulator